MGGSGRLTLAMLVTVLLVGCGSGSMATAPGGNPPGGGAGGGGTGGDVGGAGGVPASGAVIVTVGNNFFRSDHNGSVNSAVDTVVAGGKVTWTWGNTAMVPHNVESVGTPGFTSGAVETGNGSTYEMTFTTPGTYRYNCAIHGDLMTGTVVVTAQ